VNTLFRSNKGVFFFFPYTLRSSARVVLLGSGADEQCGGYKRHMRLLQTMGEDRVMMELKMEMSRIWTRNLGRDDRCVRFVIEKPCAQRVHVLSVFEYFLIPELYGVPVIVVASPDIHSWTKVSFASFKVFQLLIALTEKSKLVLVTSFSFDGLQNRWECH
jgi:hypothetical protein